MPFSLCIIDGYDYIVRALYRDNGAPIAIPDPTCTDTPRECM